MGRGVERCGEMHFLHSCTGLQLIKFTTGGGNSVRSATLPGVRFPDFTSKKMPLAGVGPAAPSAQAAAPAPLPAAGPGQSLMAPRRGKGVLKLPQAGMSIPLCGGCNTQVRCGFGLLKV